MRFSRGSTITVSIRALVRLSTQTRASLRPQALLFHCFPSFFTVLDKYHSAPRPRSLCPQTPFFFHLSQCYSEKAPSYPRTFENIFKCCGAFHEEH